MTNKAKQKAKLIKKLNELSKITAPDAVTLDLINTTKKQVEVLLEPHESLTDKSTVKGYCKYYLGLLIQDDESLEFVEENIKIMTDNKHLELVELQKLLYGCAIRYEIKEDDADDTLYKADRDERLSEMIDGFKETFNL